MPERTAATPTGHEIDSGVVRDWTDDRDNSFTADESVQLPASFELDRYRELADETWHQRGEECTGFALAAIANYLIRRTAGDRDLPSVSRRMLYEMAQRYDGEMHVEGSTLRGALKGWSRVGVASDKQWPYHPGDEHGTVHGTLNLARILDGRTRPLLGYQRIKNNDLAVMQHALAEGHPLYVAAATHLGWYRLFLHDSGPTIERNLPADTTSGIHAFVIIGYNEAGFVMHNSWGPEWGEDGYAVLPYDQWSSAATDTWVVDAGINSVPIAASVEPDFDTAKRTYREMWPHLIVLDDHGQLASSGLYEMDHGSVKTMLYLFDEHTRGHGWTNRKLAVIADGGAESPARTIERLRPLRDQLLEEEVYPIFIVWQTAWRDQLDHEVETWRTHRAEDAAPADVANLIAAAESRSGAIWDAIRGRSIQACTSPTGGARLLAQSIAYKRGQRDFGLHGVSLGAGDIVLAPLATLLAAPITSVFAVGPRTTMHDFAVTYRNLLSDGQLRQLTVVPTADDLDELIRNVWSLPGASMRQAGRDARANHQWEPEPIAMVGNEDDLARSSAMNHFRAADQLQIEHLDLGQVDAINEAIVAHIAAADSEPAGRIQLGLSRDPLARAEALRQING